MKKIVSAMAFLAMTLSPAAQAADLTGRMGLNYTVGPNFVIGGSEAVDGSRVGPHAGAGLEYGLMRNLSANFAYDDLEHGFNTQAMTLGASVRPQPQNTISPFIGAGLGIGRRYAGDGWDHMALKLSGGVEHFFTDELSGAAVLSYLYLPGSNDNGIADVHALTPGIRMTYYFGTYKRT